MKKYIFVLVCIILCLSLVFTCKKNDTPSEPEKPAVVEAPKPEPKKEDPKPAPVAEAPKSEPKKEEPKPEPKKVETPKVEPKEEVAKKEEPKPETKKVETPTEEAKVAVAPKPEPVVEPKPEPAKPKPVEQKPVVEPAKPAPVVETPKPEPVLSESDKEYQRSVKEMGAETVTKDEFEADKKEIMAIIDNLSRIMKNKDYNGWLKYLSPSSKEYWSNSANLAKVSNMLPVKGIKIRNLNDYFNYIFIPARQNSKVEEIRYISPTLTKAVEPRENEDVIYYRFEKSATGEWLLQLDKL